MDVAINTLLTGFGPFERIISNPTERLARHFENGTVSGHRLTTCVLPVSYRRAPALLLEALRQGDNEGGQPFDVLWMLGVAFGSPHWRVERGATNKNGVAADVDSMRARPYIVEGGPERIEVSLPVQPLVTALVHAGLPAVESGSAGAYLCNHLLYTALWHRRSADLNIDVGFLHVPVDGDTLAKDEPAPPAKFSFAQHIQAIEVTLAKLAKLRATATGAPLDL